MKNFKKHPVRGLLIAIILLVAVTLSVPAAVRAQNYPNRDITFIVPYAPGGSTDPVCRQFCKQLEKLLGGNINVENKPGGSGTIGAGVVVRAKPDGYTIGMATNSTLGYQPLVNRGLSYNTADDYQPIVKLSQEPVTLTVRPDAPWKTFEEFMATAKKSPGKIRVSVSGMRTIPDLVMQQLNQVAGVKITTVPFTGGGAESLIAMLGGRVEACAAHPVTVLGHVQAGTAKVLVVLQKGKNKIFPKATSVFDAGYDMTPLLNVFYVIAPKGIPKDVFDKLVAASLQVVRSEEFIKFCMVNGFEVEPKGPEALREELIQNSKVFAGLIKIVGQK